MCSCLQPPLLAYAGIDTVSVEFVSGHLRNNLRTDESFLYVEKLNKNEGTWEILAVDADWETQLEWHRMHFMLGTSKVQIRWTMPLETEPGTYRIRHAGYYRVTLVYSEMTV